MDCAKPEEGCTGKESRLLAGRAVGAAGASDFSARAGDVVLEDSRGARAPLRSLWAKSPVLVTFIRRFGCPLCRAWALQLRSIASTCTSLGVSMALVGWEKVGMEEFVRGGYFSWGDVFVDENKGVVAALRLRRLGLLDGYGLLDARAISAYREAVARGIEGNMDGDGLQLGGTFLVLPDGKTVYDFRQTSFSDHPDLDEILHLIGTHVLGDDDGSDHSSGGGGGGGGGLDFLDRLPGDGGGGSGGLDFLDRPPGEKA